MGGHAGGDVAAASRSTAWRTSTTPTRPPMRRRRRLQAAAITAAGDMIRAVKERPELAGLGTTLDAIIMVDDYASSATSATRASTSTATRR